MNADTFISIEMWGNILNLFGSLLLLYSALGKSLPSIVDEASYHDSMTWKTDNEPLLNLPLLETNIDNVLKSRFGFVLISIGFFLHLIDPYASRCIETIAFGYWYVGCFFSFVLLTSCLLFRHCRYNKMRKAVHEHPQRLLPGNNADETIFKKYFPEYKGIACYKKNTPVD